MNKNTDRFGFGDELSCVTIRPTAMCDNGLSYYGVWLVDEKVTDVNQQLHFSEVSPNPTKFPVHVLAYVDSYWDVHLIVNADGENFECFGYRQCFAETYRKITGNLHDEIERVLPMLVREDRAAELACSFYFRLDYEDDERIAKLFDFEEAEIIGDALALAHEMRAKYKKGSQNVQNAQESGLVPVPQP